MEVWMMVVWIEEWMDDGSMAGWFMDRREGWLKRRVDGGTNNGSIHR